MSPAPEHDTSRADFGSEFDRRLAEQGPGAVFTRDADGELRLADTRSREQHALVPEPHPLAWCHCLYRDRATGFVQYLLVTSPALCASHPRADIARFPTQADALDALDRLGVPPVFRGSWPPTGT
jgi:hypothetical protein